MYKTYLLNLLTYFTYSTHQPLDLETQLVSGFLCVRLLLNGLLIRLHDIVMWEYETIFNTKYFIINSKITALCNRNRLPVLTYIHTQVAVYCRGEMTETHTYTVLHTHISTLDLACTNTPISLARFLLPLPRLLSLHIHTSNYLLEMRLMIALRRGSIVTNEDIPTLYSTVLRLSSKSYWLK